MATILCVTDCLPGILFSSVELARRLVTAGHRVTYASFPAARETVVGLGIDFLPLPVSRYAEFVAADSKVGLVERLRTLPRRRERAAGSTAAADFVENVRLLSPDLILIDGEMHEYIIAASATGKPMALLNTFVSIWRSPGLPPPHVLARPGVGWQGRRLGAALLWLALRAKKRRRALLQRIRHVGCDRLSVLRHLAGEAGFDFHRQTDDGQWLIPFTYRQLPVLSLHALEFEFPHRPPDRVHYVGPMLLESRQDTRLTTDDQAALEAILRRRADNRGRSELIYAGFGSFFSTDLDLLRRIIAAVADRENRELIVSLGGRIDPGELGRLPDRVHAFNWLPQLEVLRHADVAITHGGINTIDECVVHRVPTLVYCGFETEMAGTTARVVHHAIGVAGDRRRDGPPAIREHIDGLLHDEKYGRNLERLSESYEAYRRNRVAERLVESLVAKGFGVAGGSPGSGTSGK